MSRRRAQCRRSGLIWVGAVVGLTGGLAGGCSGGSHDTSAQAERYEEFPIVPGAEKRSESTYELRSDGKPTGRYGRKVVYELPADTAGADVLAFLRSHLPAGWTEPTDATCAESMPVPPSGPDGNPIPVPDGIVLLNRGSQLTVLAPGEDGVPGPGAEGIDGFTFTLSRDGDQKLLVLDLPSLSCGVPQPDFLAEEFENGPTPIQVVPTVPLG